MAGQARKQAIEIELTIRAHTECDEGATQLDYVVQWVESGFTLSRLAQEISVKAGLDIYPAQLTRYLSDRFGDEAVSRIAVARAKGAHTMVEQALDIVDNADDRTNESLRKAEMRARSRQWTAERFNPRELGSQKGGTTVTVNLANMHLAALRQREVSEPARAFISDASSLAHDTATVDATVVDAEIVSDDNVAS